MTPEPKRATGARYASESEAAAVRRVRGAACTYYDDFARTIIAIDSFSRANCSKYALCKSIICISARAKIASRAHFGGVKIHIMHLKIHIMHFADQNVRFTNPGCQSYKDSLETFGKPRETPLCPPPRSGAHSVFYTPIHDMHTL